MLTFAQYALVDGMPRMENVSEAIYEEERVLNRSYTLLLRTALHILCITRILI